MCFYFYSGKEFDVKAKCVINATGPFTDSLRKMDNQETSNICQPSAGVHIVIPGYYRYNTSFSFKPRVTSALTSAISDALSCKYFLLSVFSLSSVNSAPAKLLSDLYLGARDNLLR